MQPLLQWKSNNYYIFWLCICSPRYLACNAHAQHCHLWPVPLYTFFPPRICYKRHDFLKKKLLNIQYVFRFYVQGFSWKSLYSRKNWARYDQKFILGFILSALYSCPILMNLEIFRQIFEKYSNIKFHENPSNENRVAACGWSGRWTDGRTDGQKDGEADGQKWRS